MGTDHEWEGPVYYDSGPPDEEDEEPYHQYAAPCVNPYAGSPDLGGGGIRLSPPWGTRSPCPVSLGANWPRT